MTNLERKHVNASLKILRKDWGLKKNGCGCKSYGFGCGCCQASRLIEELDSLINFYMMSDEENRALEKKWAKKKKSEHDV